MMSDLEKEPVGIPKEEGNVSEALFASDQERDLEAEKEATEIDQQEVEVERAAAIEKLEDVKEIDAEETAKNLEEVRENIEQITEKSTDQEYYNSSNELTIKAFEQDILARTNRDIAEMQKGAWGAYKEQSSNSRGGYGNEWDRAYMRNALHMWSGFIKTNPELANKFSDYPPIKKALEWEARKQGEGSKKQDSQPESHSNSENNLEALSPATQKLIGILKEQGVDSKVVNLGTQTFPEAIIFNRPESQEQETTEKMVRIYRGINHLDDSILSQIPYGMRAEIGGGKIKAIESIRHLVENLAQNPTYENLMIYLDGVRPNLSKEENKRLDYCLDLAERRLLEDDFTMRDILLMEQIAHSGGVHADSGIAPYISASVDPNEAVKYGREGLLVIDLPLSEIEGTGSEVSIRGALDQKYLTGIIIRNSKIRQSDELRSQELNLALKKTAESMPKNIYNDAESLVMRKEQFENNHKLDRDRQKEDINLLAQRRISKLIEKFPEANIVLPSDFDKSLEVYRDAQRKVFDFYEEQLRGIDRFGRDIEDFSYREESYSGEKKFDRDKIDEIMLAKLKILVNHLKEREE